MIDYNEIGLKLEMNKMGIVEKMINVVIYRFSQA